MIDLSEIEIETIESMTIYLAGEMRDDKKNKTNLNSPFNWMQSEYTIVGVRSQVANLKKIHADVPEMLRIELVNLMRRTCQYKNGKNQERRMKEALEIFKYLELENEFEEQLS